LRTRVVACRKYTCPFEFLKLNAMVVLLSSHQDKMRQISWAGLPGLFNHTSILEKNTTNLG
jgi:hypothetical protein